MRSHTFSSVCVSFSFLFLFLLPPPPPPSSPSSSSFLYLPRLFVCFSLSKPHIHSQPVLYFALNFVRYFVLRFLKIVLFFRREEDFFSLANKQESKLKGSQRDDGSGNTESQRSRGDDG